jgi:hypothetical protein
LNFATFHDQLKGAGPRAATVMVTNGRALG